MKKAAHLITGDCYKHIPSGKVYRLSWIIKRYGRSCSGVLSPNVLTAGFENILEHGEQVKQQIRYMDRSDWIHLGEFKQFKNSAGYYDAFVCDNIITSLREVQEL